MSHKELLGREWCMLKQCQRWTEQGSKNIVGNQDFPSYNCMNNFLKKYDDMGSDQVMIN